jgi:hypothetical protein
MPCVSLSIIVFVQADSSKDSHNKPSPFVRMTSFLSRKHLDRDKVLFPFFSYSLSILFRSAGNITRIAAAAQVEEEGHSSGKKSSTVDPGKEGEPNGEQRSSAADARAELSRASVSASGQSTAQVRPPPPSITPNRATADRKGPG